jgi:hypothetical protein
MRRRPGKRMMRFGIYSGVAAYLLSRPLGRRPVIRQVVGVDFSGAEQAGHTTWLAWCAVASRGERVGGAPPLRLTALHSLAELAGTAARAPALAHLVAAVRTSRQTLWAVDACFGLPEPVLDALYTPGATWPRLVREVAAWEDGAYAFGLAALAAARTLGGPMHIRRAADAAARAPFDPYHYRIIYQTFHAIRDVARPLARDARTAVLPFQYPRLAGARRVVLEACPASTLKRLGLPHQRYKQPAGGALTTERRRTRRAVLAGLAPHVAWDAAARRRMMRDPGGDALDAVLAAVGAWHAWRATDHGALARCATARREGHLYY